MRSGSSSLASARASASTRRPSASVLPISTVRPLRRGEDVAGAEGGAGNGVLDRRDEHAQAERQAGVHDHVGEAEHVGGAAHVLLHQQHAGGRLDVEAARIEADALADERQRRRVRVAPGKVDEAWRALRRGGGADGVDEREAVGEKALADDLGEDGAVAEREVAGGIGEFGGTEIVGGGVDQIARQDDAVGDAGDLGRIDRRPAGRGGAARRRLA